MDDVYGPLRLIGSVAAVVIYAMVIGNLFTAMKGAWDDVRAMREFTMALLLLMAALAFLVGAISIISPPVTPIVRFVNSAILGGLIAGGLHLLATMRGKHRV